MRRHVFVLINTLAVIAMTAAFRPVPTAMAATTTVEKSGYITARDGTQLRYDLVRPADSAPHPVLVNYEGYAAGTNASDNGVSIYTPDLMSRGYALLGVSVRGTGCSGGVFDPFEARQSQDGYDIVEWAARQPWSNGRVGMIGVSFGGIMQTLTAAQRPPHLVAIAASSSLSDLYRDVAFPGGILNNIFPFAWTAIQKEGGTEYAAVQAPPARDTTCLVNYANHERANLDHLIPQLVLQHPFADDKLANGDSWGTRAPGNGFPSIQVPTLLLNQWQDEQVSGRIFDSIHSFGNQSELWVNVSNGNHGRDYESSIARKLTLDFLDHFVRGTSNGFENNPHLMLWMESKIEHGGDQNVPTWQIGLPITTQPAARALYLGGTGGLNDSAPTGAEKADSYLYPLPSPEVLEIGQVEVKGHQTGQITWKTPVPPGGALAYTTAPLSQDLVLLGPASLDVWLSSTATDTDLQATITEVRPDGQETYVQRGWLRASHRKLDPALSTELRPYQTHARGDAQSLTPNSPALLRVEVFPFAHAFRAGSRLRVWIDAPSNTGLIGFQPLTQPSSGAPIAAQQPAINTILHDAAHPSRLVVGVLAGQRAQAPLPACDTLRNQPCRRDPLAGATGAVTGVPVSAVATAGIVPSLGGAPAARPAAGVSRHGADRTLWGWLSSFIKGAATPYGAPVSAILLIVGLVFGLRWVRPISKPKASP